MFRKLKRLYLEINCDHPHADRIALFSTGAEVHICKLCGRFVTIIEQGRAVPEQPRYRALFQHPWRDRERVEHYNGKHVSMLED